MPDEHRHLLDALDAIDPATLSYQEWVDCGMALHESGFSWRDWDAWSQRDPKRYHVGECESKWSSFGNGSERVTSGTIIHMAERRGWQQPSSGMGFALDWSDVGTVQVDPSWVEPEAPVGSELSPARQLTEYLTALFDDDDYVCYVTESYEVEESGAIKYKPKGGCSDRTAAELCRALAKYNDIEKALGGWDDNAGAWICFNPTNGRGRANKDIAEYRYALIESDELAIDQQEPMIRAMNLPCAAIVMSGGKSVHAIVRIDAGSDFDTYRSRVNKLHAYCREHGFQTDGSNKNPSRLSRMPGVTRRGRQQSLIATNVGAESWDAWEKWVEESEDNLPDEIVGGIGTPAKLKPMLIGLTDYDCILRQNQKMILVGDSKMGKSYTLIDLSEAICIGGEWLGMQCAKGMVYYVNLEIDEEEFRDRQNMVWDKRPESLEHEKLNVLNRNFIHMPMRGWAAPLWDIAPQIVHHVLKFGPSGTFAAIVIDPIYKVNGGDDNDAKNVARFTNTLDYIISQCGCAVIYAHHHPKGATGDRRSIDRMSGSGVYGRDADTIIDFSPLFCSDEDLRKSWDNSPMYRAEVKCRSFGYRKPIDSVFKHPRFVLDTDGKLAHLQILGFDSKHQGQIAGGEANKSRTERTWEKKLLALEDAFDNDPHNISSDTVEFDKDFVSTIDWERFGVPKHEQANAETIKGWVNGKSELISSRFEFVGKGNKILRRKAKPESKENSDRA